MALKWDGTSKASSALTLDAAIKMKKQAKRIRVEELMSLRPQSGCDQILEFELPVRMKSQVPNSEDAFLIGNAELSGKHGEGESAESSQWPKPKSLKSVKSSGCTNRRTRGLLTVTRVFITSEQASTN